MSTPTLMTILAAAASGLIGGGGGWLLARRSRPTAGPPQGEDEAARLRAGMDAERTATLRAAEVGAREAALTARSTAEAELRTVDEEIGRKATALVEREVALAASERANRDLEGRLRERLEPVEGLEREVSDRKAGLGVALAEVRGALERRVGESAADLARRLRDLELDQARAVAAARVRRIDEGAQDPEHVRSGKRLLGLVAGRFSGHYLTERHPSFVPLPAPRNGKAALDPSDLAAIASVAKVELTLADAENEVRLGGLDGVGREVARRTIGRLLGQSGARGDVTRMVKEVASEVDREVLRLGRDACRELAIDIPHADIVRLVGRLNWRTSYTQNQWKHAVEAAFLCGMMAEELGLDARLARRAALLHDIGKALTHELDGSHAVIGADYARRLGEAEVVANAIGAHHTEEPFNSPYAYLVAAADAMSGARPGARRQTEDTHLAKMGDLERIPRQFAGVADAFAVQGGREVRVMVREDAVDDLGAVKLSEEIAARISAEMTFPGQIRVTVIREVRVEEVAY